jgi:hypothetical protein
MNRPITNLMLAGQPGCGKTTVIRKTIERLQGQRLAGFYTQEVRRHGHPHPGLPRARVSDPWLKRCRADQSSEGSG